MKFRKHLLLPLTLASGIAIACSGNTLPLPIPPLPFKVSFFEMTKFKLAGYLNPVRAAALAKLDQLGSSAVGEQVWKDNNYAGYMTYASPFASVAAVRVYVEKVCGEKALDGLDKNSADASEGGSSGAYAGGGDGSGGSSSYGIVGYQPVVRTWTVCADGVCNTGTWIDYEPIYGTKYENAIA